MLFVLRAKKKRDRTALRFPLQNQNGASVLFQLIAVSFLKFSPPSRIMAEPISGVPWSAQCPSAIDRLLYRLLPLCGWGLFPLLGLAEDEVSNTRRDADHTSKWIRKR